MKAIIISNNPAFANTLNQGNFAINVLESVGTFPAGLPAMLAIKEHAPEVILMDPDIAYELNDARTKLATTTTTNPRSYISASTHHGIQLLPVIAVYYFQAEHKYVVAHHADGELLLNDSIASLEQEFTNDFVRIHRKTLVAKEYIKALEKTEAGNWQITLANCSQKLAVSRRQLAMVRKCINEYSK